MKQQPKDNEYFHYYNANPKGKNTKDCVYRALSLFLNKSWEDIAMLDAEWFLQTGKTLYGSELKGAVPYFNSDDFLKGCEVCKLSYSFKLKDNIYTIREFIDKVADPRKIYICPLQGHITVIKNNKVWDTWDCSNYGINNIYEYIGRNDIDVSVSMLD